MFSLYTSPTSPSPYVQLRDPDFGDRVTAQSTAVSRRSRGGDYRVYQDTSKKPTEVYIYSFSMLTTAQVLLVQNFFNTYGGAKIRVVTHLGVTMDGFLTNPEVEIITDRDGGCTYSMNLEFTKDTE